MPVVMGLGGAVGVVQGALYFLGGRIDSFKKESDEFERKERVRRTTRLPIEQTVSEIGEGRGTQAIFFLNHYAPLTTKEWNANKSPRKIGIEPPGYEERRRERIKETYGFEINPVKATVEGSQ